MSEQAQSPGSSEASHAGCPMAASAAPETDAAGEIPHEPEPGQSRTEVFQDFIQTSEFPCVGAKAALSRGEMRIVEVGQIDRPASDIDIRRELDAFIAALEPGGWELQTLVVIFSGPDDLSEKEFEHALWNRLQCLHNFDVVAGQEWSPLASPDPSEDHFSMSLLGEPFFIIGMHPGASRPARRFHYPTMVFNSHRQFEALREDGRFERMQKTIRKRDRELAGSVNPMLHDFGEGTEAPQYSGRKVGAEWECPLVTRKVDDD